MMTATLTSRAAAGNEGRFLTLQEFLTLTATTPAPELRPALAASLAVKTPNTPEAYSRVYCRVTMNLGVPIDTHCHDASMRAAHAA